MGTDQTAWKKRFRSFVVIVLILGIFFRFVNLEQKVFWNDEAYTALRLSGHTEAELVHQQFNGQIIYSSDLNSYKSINANKNVIDTVRSLALEDTQHPPLYYVIAWFWEAAFGRSIGALRSLSAVISLLVFPAIYWLCLELFGSALLGGIAIALVALSPFHLLYAQEAREYSLWTVTTLVSSAALLRAVRLNTRLSWRLYALALAAGLYSFLLSGLVAIAHGLYMVAIAKGQGMKVFRAYLLSSLGGLALFAPWLWVVVTNLEQIHKTTQWTEAKTLGALPLLAQITTNISHLFLDSDANPCVYAGSQPGVEFHLEGYLKYLILALVGYSIYLLCRTTPFRIWFFVLTLIGVTAFPLIIPDLVVGGERSSIPRYLISSYLGIQLAVTYLFGTLIYKANTPGWKHYLSQIAMVLLLSSSLVSCIQISQSNSWWNKYTDCCNPWVAETINQASQPLVISSYNAINTDVGHILGLSYLLKPDVQLELVIDPNRPSTLFSQGTTSARPAGQAIAQNVFLYRPSESLVTTLMPPFHIKIINRDDRFRKLL